MSKMFVMSKMFTMYKMFTRSKMFMFSIQFQNFVMVSMSKTLYTRFSFCSVYRKLTMSVNMTPPDQ
jgi:hypothetical protein